MWFLDADGFRFAVLVRGPGLGAQGEDRAAGAQGLDGEAFLFGAGCGRFRFLGGLAGEHGGDASHQVGDQGGAPGGPGGGPGGERVGLGERVQEFQGGGGADCGGDGADGRRVVEVAPGGGLDEQQMVAYEGGDDAHVVLVEADPGGRVPGDDLARHGVVSGPALADVVQQRGDQEQVGAADAAGEGTGADGRLDEVTVDGPGVDGVALGAAVDAFPVREQPGDEPFGFERLPDGDGGLAGAEKSDEFLAGLGGPGHRQRGRGGGEPAYDVAGERGSDWAAAAAARSTRTGSRSGRAVRARTTSPSASTTPSASGVRSGAAALPPPRIARSLGRTDRARRTRSTSRQVTSVAYEMVRAAS